MSDTNWAVQRQKVARNWKGGRALGVKNGPQPN